MVAWQPINVIQGNICQWAILSRIDQYLSGRLYDVTMEQYRGNHFLQQRLLTV